MQKKENTTIGDMVMMLIIITIIIITITTTTSADATLTTEQYASYEQEEVATNEEQQALISEVLNKLLNKTAEAGITIWEDDGMHITWTDTIQTTAPDGRVFEIDEETRLIIPHNFTIENGYTYRDGEIYKPDGSRLFS